MSVVLILRLILGPLQMAIILWAMSKLRLGALDLWGESGWPAQLLILTAAVPTAVNTLLMVLELGGDADLAADCVFWTTLLSPITIVGWSRAPAAERSASGAPRFRLAPCNHKGRVKHRDVQGNDSTNNKCHGNLSNKSAVCSQQSVVGEDEASKRYLLLTSHPDLRPSCCGLIDESCDRFSLAGFGLSDATRSADRLLIDRCALAGLTVGNMHGLGGVGGV